MNVTKPDIDMTPQFDRAETILAQAGMHPVMARAVIEFARYGQQHGAAANHHRTRASNPDLEHSDLLTTRQAAMRLGVSDKQIYRLVMQGRLRNRVFGRQHRFAIRDLDALIEQSSSGTRVVRAAIEHHRAA